MKKIVLLTFFSVFLLSAMFIPAGFAAIGVKEGDWIKYDYTIGDEPPEEPYPTWMKVEFLSVSGTTVTILATMHMSDGTESNQTMSGDVATGSGDISGVVIPANSKVGDSINIYDGTRTIDDESTRTYAGASRTVVNASFSEYGSQYTFYWDKQTGVVVEVSVASEDMTLTVKATGTNMWEAGLLSGPWFGILVVIVGVVVVAGSAVLLLRRRRVPLPEVAPAPTE